MTPYEQFVQQQKKNFLNQFEDDPSYCWIRVPNLESFGPRDYNKSWVPLSGFGKRDAVVWDEKGEPELWVRPVDKRRCKTSYDKTLYTRAWAAFVKQYGKTIIQPNFSNVPHAIDHLSPETASAREGYSHVRVLLINSLSNIRIGSTIEKVLANYASRAGGYCSDWTTMAKVLGMQSSWRLTRPALEIASELLTLARSEGLYLDDERVGRNLIQWIDYRRFNKLDDIGSV